MYTRKCLRVLESMSKREPEECVSEGVEVILLMLIILILLLTMSGMTPSKMPDQCGRM